METVTIHKITYRELETLANSLFPNMDYCFEADMEVKNDTVTNFDNVTKEEFDKMLQSGSWALKELLQYITGNNPTSIHMTYALLLYLVWLEELPEGNYLVENSY